MAGVTRGLPFPEGSGHIEIKLGPIKTFEHTRGVRLGFETLDPLCFAEEDLYFASRTPVEDDVTAYVPTQDIIHPYRTAIDTMTGASEVATETDMSEATNWAIGFKVSARSTGYGRTRIQY